MKLSKVFKKDTEKYLGIIPDRRRKDFQQFIAENGGYTNAIETLKSRLSEKTEFKVKKEVRQKQVKVQKKYETKKRETTEYRYIGNITVQLMITRMLENPNGSREKKIDISIEYEDIRFDKITNAIKLNGDIDEEVDKAIKQLDKKNVL